MERPKAQRKGVCVRSDLERRWSRRLRSQTVDHCEGQDEKLGSLWGRRVSLCHLQEAGALSNKMVRGQESARA